MVRGARTTTTPRQASVSGRSQLTWHRAEAPIDSHGRSAHAGGAHAQCCCCLCLRACAWVASAASAWMSLALSDSCSDLDAMMLAEVTLLVVDVQASSMPYMLHGKHQCLWLLKSCFLRA